MHNWFAFIVLLLGALAGFYLLATGGDWRNALTATFFFGSGTLVMADVLRSKARFKRQSKQVGQVEMPGYVPFHNTTLRMWCIATGLVVMGILWGFISNIDPVATFLGYFLLIAGLILSAGMVSGWLKRSFMLTEQGIQFDEPWGRYRIEWDNIDGITVVEWSSQLVVCIKPKHLERVFAGISGQDARKQRRKLRKKLQSNAYTGCAGILLMPAQYGLDAGWTYRAFCGYWQNDSTRKKLAVKRIA